MTRRAFVARGAILLEVLLSIALFVGAGSFDDAVNYSLSMTEITAGPNPGWALQTMNMMGVPTGIDIRNVVETGLAPVINTAIVHHRSGKGQIGAGVSRAPLACFEDAVVAFAETMGVS